MNARQYRITASKDVARLFLQQPIRLAAIHPELPAMEPQRAIACLQGLGSRLPPGPVCRTMQLRAAEIAFRWMRRADNAAWLEAEAA